jgi:hypothetical protein
MAPKNIPSISFAIESFTINDDSQAIKENDITNGSIKFDNDQVGELQSSSKKQYYY